MDGHEYQCFGSFWNELAAQSGGWQTHLTSACAYGAIGQKLLLVLCQLSEKVRSDISMKLVDSPYSNCK